MVGNKRSNRMGSCQVEAAVSGISSLNSHRSELRKECSTKHQDFQLKAGIIRDQEIGLPLNDKGGAEFLEKVHPHLEQFPTSFVNTKRRS